MAMKKLHSSGHMVATHVDSDSHITTNKLQTVWTQEGNAVSALILSTLAH